MYVGLVLFLAALALWLFIGKTSPALTAIGVGGLVLLAASPFVLAAERRKH
jgi:hypothetical protein